MFNRALILALLLLMVATVSAKIFKWVDENGVTHYSETQPTKQKVQEIRVQPAPPVAGGGSINPATKHLQEREIEFQKRKAEREAAEKIQELKDTSAKHEAVENKKKCIFARQNLFTLQEQKPVFTINENGEREYIDDKTRATAIERMKKDIESYCEHP